MAAFSARPCSCRKSSSSMNPPPSAFSRAREELAELGLVLEPFGAGRGGGARGAGAAWPG